MSGNVYLREFENEDTKGLLDELGEHKVPHRPVTAGYQGNQVKTRFIGASIRGEERKSSSGRSVFVMKAAVLCAAFLAFGVLDFLPEDSVGDVTEDFQPKQHGTAWDVIRKLGIASAMVTGCILLGYCNRQFIIFLSLGSLSILLFIIPWVKIYWMSQVLNFLLGYFSGIILLGGNVICIDFFGKNSIFYIYALHFAFSIGLITPSLVFKPLIMSDQQIFSNKSTESFNIYFPSYNKKITRLQRSLQSNDESMTLINKIFADEKITTKVNEKKPLKLKPTFTDGRKLDNSKDWDKIKIQEPPLEQIRPKTKNKKNLEKPVMKKKYTIEEIFDLNKDISSEETANTAASFQNRLKKREVENKEHEFNAFDNDNLNDDANTDFYVLPDLSTEYIFPFNETQAEFNETISSTTNKPTDTTYFLTQKTKIENIISDKPSDSLVKSTYISNRHRVKPTSTFDNDTETIISFIKQIEKLGLSYLDMSYLILAIYMTVITLFFLVCLCNNPREPRTKQEEYMGLPSNENKKIKCLFLLTLLLMLFFYSGILTCVTQFNQHLFNFKSDFVSFELYYYCIKSLSNFIIIFISIILPAGVLINIGLFLVFAAIIGLLLIPDTSIVIGTFICVSFIAFGLSIILPSSIVWAQSNFFITNTIISLIYFVITVGHFVLPYFFQLLKCFVENQDFIYKKESLIGFMVLCSFLSFITFFCLSYIAKKYRKLKYYPENAGYELAEQDDLNDDLESVFSEVLNNINDEYEPIIQDEQD